MRHTGHHFSAINQRLRSLMRSHGSQISQFPPSFFTPVQRPRGRPPAVIRQLRAIATVPRLPSAPRAGPPNRPDASTMTPPGDLLRIRSQGQSKDCCALTPSVLTCTQVSVADLPPNTSHRTAAVTPRAINASIEQETAVLTRPAAMTTPLLSPREAEKAVASVFAAISAKLVRAYDGNSIHHNVGEILPAGITKLLEEVAVVGGHDIFVDIGAGLGNLVAQVILQTQVHRAIGIEIREDVQRAGVDAVNKSLYWRAFQERASFICQDITGIPSSESSALRRCNRCLLEQPALRTKDSRGGERAALLDALRTYFVEWCELLFSP
ncbi:hypothetical protein V7S43_007014 [Phytophthora oleae]|uniref:DOT1 domain-containing protein n=1 Tax=Phytophthora oleae TaxID=2107226 RepID=A0ABD3FNX4_9STRA